MKLIYGTKYGVTVHISQVERGLSCGCFCPVCGYPLVAKKGKLKQHHFAHHIDSECNVETVIHFLAKQIIKDAGEIYIPDTEVPKVSMMGDSIKLSTAMIIKLDDVEDEKYMGNITPDIIGYYKKTPLLIEIFVTHKTDNTKIGKIKSLSLSAIEIDLSNINYDTGIDELTQLVLYDKENRYWLNNNRAEIKRSQLHSGAVVRKAVYDELHGSLLFDCPISEIKRPGKSYVLLGDCLYCEYGYGITGFPENVLCGNKKNSV